jgi:hypothetical protein
MNANELADEVDTINEWNVIPYGTLTLASNTCCKNVSTKESE